MCSLVHSVLCSNSMTMLLNCFSLSEDSGMVSTVGACECEDGRGEWGGGEGRESGEDQRGSHTGGSAQVPRSQGMT